MGSIGDVEKDLSANGAKKFRQQSCSRHSIYVVVTIDQNGLFLMNGGYDSLYSYIHVGKEVGIVEVRELGIKKFMDFFHRLIAPGNQDLSDYRMDVKL